jgi:hypothetical protein
MWCHDRRAQYCRLTFLTRLLCSRRLLDLLCPRHRTNDDCRALHLRIRRPDRPPGWLAGGMRSNRNAIIPINSITPRGVDGPPRSRVDRGTTQCGWKPRETAPGDRRRLGDQQDAGGFIRRVGAWREWKPLPQMAPPVAYKGVQRVCFLLNGGPHPPSRAGLSRGDSQAILAGCANHGCASGVRKGPVSSLWPVLPEQDEVISSSWGRGGFLERTFLPSSLSSSSSSSASFREEGA